jgi:tripartite-type tricarboxylate transporter receptor subunit TctC
MKVGVKLGELAARIVSAGSLALLTCVPAVAQSTAEYFKGKTVSFVVGFGPGGANDVWARVIARHISRHWPGNPGVVVQNQPGAGGLTLINQLVAVAPKDGTTIGLISRGIPLEPLLGGQGIQMDPRRMTWIGSPDRDTTVCAARKDAAVQRMQDLFDKELVVGATGSGADTAIYPEFLTALLGMKFKTVKGYTGSNDIFLAMERGEVQGICLASDSLARIPMLRQGRANILFQAGLKPDARLKDVPVGIDLARTSAERDALQLFFARVALGRPFVAPPGMAAERVAVIRAAFTATLADKDFVEDASKQGLTVDPISGEEIAGVIEDAYKTPPETIARTINALGR